MMQQVREYNFEEIVGLGQTYRQEMEEMGVKTNIVSRENDPYLLANPDILGYYNRDSKTVVVEQDSLWEAQSHEYIHAKRDLNGSYGNLVNVIEENPVLANNPGARQRLIQALEEAGTISENIAANQEVRNGYAVVLSEEEYLKRVSQNYLQALKDSGYPVNLDDFYNINSPIANDFGQLLIVNGKGDVTAAGTGVIYPDSILDLPQ
jgi:hypothetical protein